MLTKFSKISQDAPTTLSEIECSKEHAQPEMTNDEMQTADQHIYCLENSALLTLATVDTPFLNTQCEIGDQDYSVVND